MNNQSNAAMESSTTLALTGLNVVIEDESDYVFVPGGEFDGDHLNLDEWEDDDDDDWTNCDLSPSLSCATSVATNVTLRDLNLIEDSLTMAPMDVDNAMETDATRNLFSSNLANPKNGRRLSNKKLRKKMKLMKKAAAARAAAEALAAQQKEEAMASSSESTAAMSTEEEMPPTVAAKSSRMRMSPKRKPGRSTNMQVACAQESLAQYREEIEAGKGRKKTRAVSIDLP